MHAPAMKYTLSNFSTSVCKLNAINICVKTGTVQHENEW